MDDMNTKLKALAMPFEKPHKTSMKSIFNLIFGLIATGVDAEISVCFLSFFGAKLNFEWIDLSLLSFAILLASSALSFSIKIKDAKTLFEFETGVNLTANFLPDLLMLMALFPITISINCFYPGALYPAVAVASLLRCISGLKIKLKHLPAVCVFFALFCVAAMLFCNITAVDFKQSLSLAYEIITEIFPAIKNLIKGVKGVI